MCSSDSSHRRKRVSWWLWVLLACLALALPVAVVLGRMIRLGQGGDLERPRPVGRQGVGRRLPSPRDGSRDRST